MNNRRIGMNLSMSAGRYVPTREHTLVSRDGNNTLILGMSFRVLDIIRPVLGPLNAHRTSTAKIVASRSMRIQYGT